MSASLQKNTTNTPSQTTDNEVDQALHDNNNNDDDNNNMTSSPRSRRINNHSDSSSSIMASYKQAKRVNKKSTKTRWHRKREKLLGKIVYWSSSMLKESIFTNRWRSNKKNKFLKSSLLMTVDFQGIWWTSYLLTLVFMGMNCLFTD